MKFALSFFLLFFSLNAFAQSNQADINRQIEEIMKAREEMLKSLLNDSGFQNFDDAFGDMVKKFEQDSFTRPGMDTGAVIGEYDWRETDTQQIFVLKVKQIKDKPLDIKIEKGQIKLKGDVESQDETQTRSGKKSKHVTKVHFERTFSIPAGVDQTNPEFENKDGELLIKFKKLNASKTPMNKTKIKGKVPQRESLPPDREPVSPDAGDATI
jgi:HSP20 family molecular chaperone IbpA